MTTPFERSLAAEAWREIPASWKTRILPREMETAIWPTWLWPHPAAWVAVEVCWVVIACFALAGPHGAELCTTSPEIRLQTDDPAGPLNAGRLQRRYALLIQREEEREFFHREINGVNHR